MKIEAAQRLTAAGWPQVGVYGIEGTYSTTFAGSPNTANKFVTYLESLGAKNISTGRRGSDYLIGWDKPFVDVPDWKRKGFPVQASMLTAGRGTGEGAGALFYALDTQKFLILLRADDGDDGNCWCCLGGGRDIVDGQPEPLETTVRREAFEESGLPMDADYKLIHVGTKRYPDGFTFTNYLALIPEEFLPVINEEHKSFQWVDWDQLPKNMHTGMMETFSTPEAQKVLKVHTTAFDHY